MYHFDRKVTTLSFLIELNPFVALRLCYQLSKETIKLKEIYLQSASMSFPSLVPRLSFNDLRLNEPPVGAPDVPRLSKNGRTGATGLRC